MDTANNYAQATRNTIHRQQKQNVPVVGKPDCEQHSKATFWKAANLDTQPTHQSPVSLGIKADHHIMDSTENVVEQTGSGSVADSDKDPSSTSARQGRWWMPLATVCMAILPFAILEMSLRFFAPQPINAVAVDPYVDLQLLQPLFQLDTFSNEWKIPAHRMNFFRPATFPANKNKATKRIFILGGSTVQGRPFSTETAFPIWMEMRLRAAFPETDFEVVNVGGISYASYRVSKLVSEVLKHEPDAIVLYTGHNEFLEDREYGALLNAGRIQTWLTSMAGNIRMVSWLQERFSTTTTPTAKMPTEVDARLDHVGGLKKYHRDPTWKDGVEEHFDTAFLAMVHQIKNAKIPLWVCMPTCDLVNTPPFKVELSNELSLKQRKEWQTLWKIANDKQLPAQQRLIACDHCLSIDPLDAGAQYIAGRLLYEQGRIMAATEHLSSAKDLDVCPLRATTAIEQAVVRIATQQNIPIIQTPNLFDQRDANGNRIPDGIADPEFFVDHLHPSIRGHQILGKALADSMIQKDLFAELPRPRNALLLERRSEALTQQQLATLGEAYYARGKQRLKGLRRWAAGRTGQTPDVNKD